MNYIFIRNDDVRETLDKELIEITNICIKNNIPISHAVEPANVTPEVIHWLLEKKTANPSLIEIIQHGYSHAINFATTKRNRLYKGEFGGSRGYNEQFEEIKKGKELMDKYFEDNWFPIFTFPYGKRNVEALFAVKNLGFKATNGSFVRTTKHKLLYLTARLLKKPMLFGKSISWNLEVIPKINIFQIDVGVSFIKSYNDEGAIFFNLEYLKRVTTELLNRTDSIGVVLHHRYHGENEILLFEQYINWLLSQETVKIVSQEYLYNKYCLNE